MNKTKIEWVINPDGSRGFTWNPVTGCLHGCSYCYARKIAERFRPKELSSRDSAHIKLWSDNACSYTGRVPFPWGFHPTFYPLRLNDPIRRKKPATIFVCSMADLFGEWVPDEWIEAVLETVRACPQHMFVFLTKYPERYLQFMYPVNCRLGATATDQTSWEDASAYLTGVYATTGRFVFVSAEPLLRSIKIPIFMRSLDWLIIGADSTRGAEKPDRRWIMGLLSAARHADVPVFMKDNLGPFAPLGRDKNGKAYLSQELPKGVAR